MARWPNWVPAVAGREVACSERWGSANIAAGAKAQQSVSRGGGEASLQGAAAAEYDRAFAHVTAHFMPFMLRAAHIAPGMRVLDIATGTGLSAEVALAAVGPPRAALIPLLTADLPLKM
jgi:hypothetical protein